MGGERGTQHAVLFSFSLSLSLCLLMNKMGITVPTPWVVVRIK